MSYHYFPDRREESSQMDSDLQFNDASTIGPNDSVSQIGQHQPSTQEPLPTEPLRLRERSQLMGARSPPPSVMHAATSDHGVGGPVHLSPEPSTSSPQRYSWIAPSQIPSAEHEYHHPLAVDPFSPSASRHPYSYSQHGHAEEAMPADEGADAYYDYRAGNGMRAGHSSAELPLVDGAAGFSGHGDVEAGDLVRGKLRTPSGVTNSMYYSPVYGEEDFYIHPVQDGLENQYHAGGMGEEEQGFAGDKNATKYPPDQPTSLDPSRIEPAPAFSRLFYDRTDQRRRIWEYQRGIGVQKYPWGCWVLAGAMTVVVIIELVRMHAETGSFIATTPSFNVMIGPSASVLINLGARFAGCAKFITGISDINWVCLPFSNTATVTASQANCTMSDICGFGGFPTSSPNQSFRFVLPIFLHAGVVHLLLNMVAQLLISAQIERQMGTPKFLVLYFVAGIGGFIMGMNFAIPGQPSVGASGAIYGTEGALLVDLVAHWGLTSKPVRKLIFLIIEIIVGLGLGLIPG